MTLVEKGNQPTLQEELHQAITKAFDEHSATYRRHQKTVIKHGRMEYREVVVLPFPQDSAVFDQWESIQTIGTIYRTREVNGKFEESSETFITSLPCKVRDITKRIRDHWGTESQQHYPERLDSW